MSCGKINRKRTIRREPCRRNDQRHHRRWGRQGAQHKVICARRQDLACCGGDFGVYSASKPYSCFFNKNAVRIQYPGADRSFNALRLAVAPLCICATRFFRGINRLVYWVALPALLLDKTSRPMESGAEAIRTPRANIAHIVLNILTNPLLLT